MYAKVFRQIYESSIAEDYETRHVFMDMLVLADSDGVVDMTHEAIARITNVPLDKVRAAITKLESPDNRSRTPDHDGCRLIRLDDHRDWGWLIVNYGKFRGTATEEKRREQTRLRVRRLRERQAAGKQNGETPCNTGNALHAVTYASSSPSSSALQGGVGGDVELPDRFPRSPDDAVRCAMTTGCDATFITDVWNKAMGRGGRDAKDVPIRFWSSYVQTEWKYEKERRAKAVQGNGNSRPFPRDIKLQMDAIQKQIDEHPANPTSVNCRGKPTELQAASLKSLRKKHTELNALLANGGNCK